ncbi:MAG: divalent-cation tolerance protein CutA [Crocosphaera sp.]|nr:divalent-cation tolerance protein CutA [Crocosphaera sp.]
MSSEFIAILTTTSRQEDAKAIAKTLLERKLAGCIQIIGPITSHYYWQDELCQDEEWICLIKTHQKNYKTIETTIQEIHSYEIPEIISLPILEGSDSYLSWLKQHIN